MSNLKAQVLATVSRLHGPNYIPLPDWQKLVGITTRGRANLAVQGRRVKILETSKDVDKEPVVRIGRLYFVHSEARPVEPTDKRAKSNYDRNIDNIRILTYDKSLKQQSADRHGS